MNRQEYNRKILSTLEKIVEKNPDLRFGQILVITDVLELKYNPITNMIWGAEDPFDEESEATWERVKNNKIVLNN